MPSTPSRLQATGRGDEAREAARARLDRRRADRRTDEQRLLAAFGGAFGPDDHDRRMEVLLGNGDTQSAARSLIWAPPAQARPVRGAARAADPGAPTRRPRLAALDAAAAARRRPDHRPRQLAAQHRPERRGARRCSPAGRGSTGRRPMPRPGSKPLLTLARGAANDRNWSIAYGIASQARRPLSGRAPTSAPAPMASATNIPAWSGSAATTALHRLEPARRRGPPVRSLRAAPRARRRPGPRASTGRRAPRTRPARPPQANAWLEQAAASPDQFYGQLALERLGRTPPPPAAVAAERRRRARRLRRAGRSPRRCAISAWSAAAATRPCSSGRWPESLEDDGERDARRRVRPADRPARSRRLGGARGAQQGRDLLCARRLPRSDRSRPPIGTIGRPRTASSARKARSTAARSARPARAA